MHTTNEQTEHEWHLRNWETHLWFYDLHCLIFPVGRMKVCVYFFPRQLWSLPSRKWSSGVCKGNLALIVKTNTAQPALCSPWAAVGTTALFCCQIQEGGDEKNTMNLYQSRERGHLVLLIVTDPWQWTERSLCELPFISTTLPYAPQAPTSLHPSILWNMYKANRGGVDAQTFLYD